VKRVAEEERPRAGIIIPDTAKEKRSRARCLALATARSRGRKVRALDIKRRRVLFSKYAGTEIRSTVRASDDARGDILA